jgi:hypothetical protein
MAIWSSGYGTGDWAILSETPYVKDGINNYIVAGRQDAANPAQTGTKASAHYQLSVGTSETAVVRLRLSNTGLRHPFGIDFDQIIDERRQEADAFYAAITPACVGEDQANVMRQALAGMLWSKQYFFYDTDRWLEEHGADPMRPSARQVRNREWFHGRRQLGGTWGALRQRVRMGSRVG